MLSEGVMELVEARETEKLLARLEEVATGKLWLASQRALTRLHLFATGQVHARILRFFDDARAIILRAGDSEGKIDGGRGFAAQSALMSGWDETMTGLTEDLQRFRREAVSIPFGVGAVMHDRLVVDGLELVDERGKRKEAPIGLRPLPPNSSTNLGEAVRGGAFEGQMQILLDVAAQHLYGDGLNLSARIWNMDRASREGINAALMKGIADGDSAWNVARNLQQFLGASADCPRWTSSRLYQLSKEEIAKGNATGLISGKECDGRGVSYNALRLARTEIQKVHALATDKVMAMQPWVLKEQTNLSQAHPETDECDDVVQGGEGGKGIYEKGTIEYPLHPNCLCFKTAVMMPEEEFTSQLRGWVKGTEAWPEMDGYARGLGVPMGTDMSKQPVTAGLAVWLFGKALGEWLGVGG